METFLFLFEMLGTIAFAASGAVLARAKLLSTSASKSTQSS